MIFEPKIIDAKEAVYQILTREYDRIQQLFNSTDLNFNIKVTTSYPLTEKNLDTGTVNVNNLFGGSQAQITIARVSSPGEEAFISEQLGPANMVDSNNAASHPSMPPLLGQNGKKFLMSQGRLQHDVIEVRIWTLHSQLRDELYKLTQQIMFEQLPEMREEFGLWDVRKVSGMDLEVSAEWLPRTIFVGNLNYSILYPMVEIRSDDLIDSITVTVSAINSSLNYTTVGTETVSVSS